MIESVIITALVSGLYTGAGMRGVGFAKGGEYLDILLTLNFGVSGDDVVELYGINGNRNLVHVEKQSASRFDTLT